MREAELAQRLGDLLQGIHVPNELLTQLEKALAEHERAAQFQQRQQRDPMTRLAYFVRISSR
jgi:hypothetical protein